MQSIIDELKNTFKTELLAGNKQGVQADAVYLRVSPKSLTDIMQSIGGKGLILIALFAVENFEADGLNLLYVFERPGSAQLLTLVVSLKEVPATSAAVYFPNACYFEREIADGFGIEFAGAFDNRRLFLHEAYPKDFHPLLKSFKNKHLETDLSRQSKEAYVFRECSGEGVYQIPVGPVHAGIIEPGHFRFSVIGETIFNLEIRHFYKHRGLEKLAEGKTPLDCAAIAEAVSGDESAANATAFALAVENICGVAAPLRAWQLRTILLELERAYSHLGDMAGMALDVAFPLGSVPFFNMREEVLRQNWALTGSRFSKGIIGPGGLKRDITSSSLSGLSAYLNAFVGRLEEAVARINASSWVIDRFETTGVLGQNLVAPLNLSGPAARACGLASDTRIDHPYGIYAGLNVETYPRQEGDVLARFHVKADEIKNSIRMIQDVIDRISSGPVLADCSAKDGYCMSLVESARGQNLHWVFIKNGHIERYKVRTASFCNWPAIEHAVMGNIVPDFPVINKSLNLSYAGNDL